jgi:hypothetical protein
MSQHLYLGAAEAAQLVGRDVRYLAGSDVSVERYGRGGRGERFAEVRPQHHGGWHLQRHEWERIHPGHSWEHRERRRMEWERMNPGIPFVGAEAVETALAQGGGGGGGPAGWSYPFPPRAALINAPDPTLASRQVLPMNTGTTPVPIGLTAQITSRPQRVAFRPERVFVSAADTGGSGSAANWIINDITIGNRSQFAQSGALPGDMFATQAIDSFVTFETAQTAMDVVMIVTYQGATEGGTPFYGSIIGTAAI